MVGVTTILSVFGGGAWAVNKRYVTGEVARLITESLARLEAKLDQRFDSSDSAKREISNRQNDMALELAKQFGGNGNGMRQAINDLTVNMGRLEGRFDQHVKECGSK